MGGPEDVEEERWIREQRARVVEYLEKQGVDHRGVADYPAFHVHPYLAFWAVQSKQAPGQVGWWAVSGDCPTDYLGSADGRHPRDAMRALALRWREMSAFMLRGEKHPTCSIGTPETWPELGALLSGRAETLLDFSKDDSLWES